MDMLRHFGDAGQTAEGSSLWRYPNAPTTLSSAGHVGHPTASTLSRGPAELQTE